MARRKQTTARPEKIPIKTERMRKKISSLKTPSSVENRRCGIWMRARVGELVAVARSVVLSGVRLSPAGVFSAGVLSEGVLSEVIGLPPRVRVSSGAGQDRGLAGGRRQRRFAARSERQRP